MLFRSSMSYSPSARTPLAATLAVPLALDEPVAPTPVAPHPAQSAMTPAISTAQKIIASFLMTTPTMRIHLSKSAQYAHLERPSLCKQIIIRTISPREISFPWGRLFRLSPSNHFPAGNMIKKERGENHMAPAPPGKEGTQFMRSGPQQPSRERRRCPERQESRPSR